MTRKHCAIGYTKAKLAGHEILYADGIAQCVTGALQNERLPTEERSSAQTLVEAVLDYLEYQEESGVVVRSGLCGRWVPGSKPDSNEDPPCMWPVARQIIHRDQTSSRWCGVEAWRGGVVHFI
ncbi:hypothetical protein AVEN_215639-1 [Araneus ventricosus]|uniref:Uncharacterized protein n=1 Tax=Araneus ventricosus TaxID=182803 RepID=A0A4Y2KF81_ARAVE|nr:hypothetical protein AVEN_215639-1 [Araneus ventricosus]